MELSHRGQRSGATVLIVRKALDSEYDVIGVPRVRVEDGYLWIIANPSSPPVIKSLPKAADGVVTPEGLNLIRALPSIQREVVQYVESFAPDTGITDEATPAPQKGS